MTWGISQDYKKGEYIRKEYLEVQRNMLNGSIILFITKISQNEALSKFPR